MLFGTSGIRGLYGKEVNEELAMKVANIFAESDVVVGRDTRQTGSSLTEAVISGVLSRGKNAISLGIVPTPTLALATRKYKCNGIMITASHNPPEYNGLKLFTNGKEISKAREKEIEDAFSRMAKLVQADWNKVGKTLSNDSILDEHKKLILSLVDSSSIAKRKPKVVIDSNGAGAVLTPLLLKDLGCEVISINDSLSGFSRSSEPNEANLKQLCETVKKTGADLGLGHDGDADRVVAVDENGNVLPLDIQLALMCVHELHHSKNKAVISTMEASLCVREAVESVGGSIEITPVGSLYVMEALERNGALFGGEPCGEYIFEKGIHCPDGPLAAAKIVELFVKNGKLSLQAAKFRQYPMAREKFKSEKKYSVVEALKAEINIPGKRNEEDGLRIDEDDGWFLIRASGTEPIIRLTMEYKNIQKLDKRKNELSLLIEKSIKIKLT